MSTILKALRRLEDDEASQREEQRTELRGHLVSAPASPEPRRFRVLVWLLAIPGAGILGALVAALLLPRLLGGELPASSPALAMSAGASSPGPTRAESPSPPRSASAAGPTPVQPARAESEFSRQPVPADSASSPQPARAESVSPRASSPVVASTAEAGSERSLAETLSAPNEPVGEPLVEPTALPPVAAARSASPQTREHAVPAREIEISDDFAVIERNPVPSVLVTQTIWHPRADRRVAVIERLDAADGAESLRMREGDRVGSLQLVSIEPTGVVFVHNGIELRRRVGARP